MRFHLRLSPNTEPVPFDHLHQLTRAIHKWLGADNREHDSLSLYSFGWLRNGQPARGGLRFPDGTEWTVSFLGRDAAARVIEGIQRDPVVAFGMRVFEVRKCPPPLVDAQTRFLVDGAVLTRRNRDDGGRDHLTFEDSEADDTLTRTIRRKLAAAGLDDAHREVSVRFDRSFRRARTKLVTIKGIQYRTSECPVIIEGTEEATRTAWLVGVGEMTGSGLGALR